MPPTKEKDGKGSAPKVAKLKKSVLADLTLTVSDIRATVPHLCSPADSLETLATAGAIVAMRDLSRLVQNEDPLDAMPARKVLGDWAFGAKCALPILRHIGPDAELSANPPRWAAALYQTVRLLTVLTAPVEAENTVLAAGCNLEAHLMELKGALATAEMVVDPIVALLQFYMEKKAEKVAQFALAEDCKLEDARMENILHLFRNLLTPPREDVPKELMALDRSTHIAVVGACVRADLFSSLSLLFAAGESTRDLDTRFVLLSSEIFALAFRHSSARELALHAARAERHGRKFETGSSVLIEPSSVAVDSVFESADANIDDCEEAEAGAEAEAEPEAEPETEAETRPRDSGRLPGSVTGSGRVLQQASGNSSRRGAAGAGLRAALQRERSLVGGGRSVIASGRWTTRHSGGFHVVSGGAAGGSRARGGTAAGGRSTGADSQSRNASIPGSRVGSGLPGAGADGRAKNLVSKRIVSARALFSAPKKGFAGVVQTGMQTNCELLCVLGAKGRVKVSISSGRASVGRAIRSDLVRKGRLALGELAKASIADCFPLLLPELHERVLSAKSQGNVEVAWAGRRFCMKILATVTGFQRESATLLSTSIKGARAASVSTNIQKVAMDEALGLPSVDVAIDWKAVEMAIGPECFRVVFDSLIDARDEGKPMVKELELAATALMEMMKLLQCMTSCGSSGKGENTGVTGDAAAGTSTSGENPSSPAEQDTGDSVPGLVICMNKGKSKADRDGQAGHVSSSSEGDDTDEEAVEGEDGGEESRKVAAVAEGEDGHASALGDAEADIKEPADEPDTESRRSIGEKTMEPQEGGSEQVPASSEKSRLSPREFALNTLEELFETEKYLEVPAMLAKDFSPKHHSFRHLANTIEIAFAFTATLERFCEGERRFDDDSEDEEDGKKRNRDVLQFGPEGVDVIRRFASGRTLQNIALALRAALCVAPGTSSSVLPLPDGSSELTSTAVVARSLAVLRSVWNVVSDRERGSLRGTFYNYAMLQLFGLAISVAEKRKAEPATVMGLFAEFAREVTAEFYKVLLLNPGVLMDTLFMSDLGVHRQYAGKMHKASLKNKKERGTGLAASSDYCSSDADPSDLEAEDTCRMERARSRKRSTHGKKRKAPLKKEKERDTDSASSSDFYKSEDLDLSDVDKLDADKPDVEKTDAGKSDVDAEDGSTVERARSQTRVRQRKMPKASSKNKKVRDTNSSASSDFYKSNVHQADVDTSDAEAADSGRAEKARSRKRSKHRKMLKASSKNKKERGADSGACSEVYKSDVDEPDVDEPNVDVPDVDEPDVDQPEVEAEVEDASIAEKAQPQKRSRLRSGASSCSSSDVVSEDSCRVERARSRKRRRQVGGESDEDEDDVDVDELDTLNLVGTSAA